MSKLIVCTGTLAAGGAERVLSILSKPFADAFEEVQYVMWLDAKYPNIFYDIDPRVRIVRMSKESGSTSVWRQMIWFRQYVKKEKPDLVLSFMVMICFTVTVSLLFSGIRQVVAERNDPRFFKKKWLRRIINLSYLSSDVKGILMQTESNKKYFKNSTLYAKTSVIYNPLNIEARNVGAALNASKDDLVVSVGRLTIQKQQGVLLDAFARFHQSHPAYKLIIYGDGEMRESLLEQAERLGVKDFFKLPGRSKQVLRDILPAKIFVMTSLFEGMSNALAEAMCVGLPCISTKVSGATDLIQDGKNGLLAEVGDVDGISEKMNAIANNQELASQIASNATKIHELLDEERVSSKWIEYLKEKISA